MKKDFETNFTAWSFIVAAWIWMYRIHIFGWVTMGIAMFALVSITARKPYRVIILPGAGMVIIGTFTLAIASAYFYNHGAWGVGQTAGKSAVEIQEFMHNLLFTNQYVTCFIRFGRIFSGVGLILLGVGFVKWKIVSTWLGWFTILLGLAAMGIIIGIPDNFEIYKPIFHVKVIWLLMMGIELLKKGVHLSES